MKSSFKIILFKSASVLIGCLVAIVICELLLRIYNPLPARIRGNEIRIIANYERIIKLEVSNHDLDSFIHYSTNSIGFRGAERPELDDEYYEIFTVGGSTTECALLDDEKTWSAILARTLPQCKSKLWINNAGIGGCSTYGHLMLLDEHVLAMKPDMILFLVGANDLLKGHYNIKDEFLQTGLRYKKMKLMAKSELFSLLLNLYRSQFATRARVNHNFNQQPIKELSDETLKARLQLHKNNQDAYANRLKMIITLCQQNNILPVLITQPIYIRSKYDICHEIDIYNVTTLQTAKESSIPSIDLADQLENKPEYYYDNMHFTNQGAEAVARLLHAHLCDSIFNHD
jgi:lysophospholipase L1-like esterase